MEEQNQQKTTQKRQVAIKARISEITNGKYFKEEGWKPNYIITNTNKIISRANIIGVIVSEPSIETTNQNITIDDGTGRITVRSFDDKLILNKYNTGEIVMIIGRPREYNGEKYLVPEIIKTVEDKRWIEVRKKELEKEKIADKTINTIEDSSIVREETIEENVEDNEVIEEKQCETSYEKIIKTIREMDTGSGVNIEEVILRMNDPNSEKILNSLLEEGEIFEIRPGMIKVLE
jgi:RPA family protein